MIGAIVEEGSVVAAVSEKGNQNAEGDRKQDIVDVVIAVHEKGSGNETGPDEGLHDGQPLPEAGMVVGESLQFRVEVKSQECADEEGFRRVAAGKRLHREEQGVLG